VKATSTALCLLLAVVATSSRILVTAQLLEPYDFVYQDMDGEAHVVSPREANARYSFIVRNVRMKNWEDFSISGQPGVLDSRLVSPGYTFSFVRVYDSMGDLNYKFTHGDGESPSIRIFFRKTVVPGESYGFSFEYGVKWDYDSYSWSVGWSTSQIIEKMRLKISVSDQLRIVRTYPAGVFSDDRESAEIQATNVRGKSLSVSFPPTKGEYSVLALLVEFSDVKHRTDREEISLRILREVESYFREASYNLISIEGHATDWIWLPRSAESYGISAWGSPAENRRVFEREVIKLADDLVDYSRYDVVFVIAAGTGTVWAYSTTALIRTNDGVSIERLTIQAEYTPWGTFAHEFGHQLGLPDLYDYGVAARPGVYLEAAIHVGPYGLMSRSTERPNMLGWCKLTLGWIDPSRVLTIQPGEVKSVRIGQLQSPSNEIVLVKIPITQRQYYLVEVRDRTSYDSVLPDSGVLITFVNESAESGYGPVRLIDANPATKSLDDAPFDLGLGENSAFGDWERAVGIVILQKMKDGYVVHSTKPERLEEAKEFALESTVRIEQAEREIEKVRSEVQPERLNDALKELEQARRSLAQADYSQAARAAIRALELLGHREAAEQAFPMGQLLLSSALVVIVLLIATITLLKKRSRRIVTM